MDLGSSKPKRSNKHFFFTVVLLALFAALVAGGMYVSDGSTSEFPVVGSFLSVFDNNGSNARLDIVFEGNPGRITLPVQNDVKLHAGDKITINTESSDITILLEDESILKNFNGDITFTTEGVVFDGKAEEYSGDSVNINWKSNEHVHFTLTEGTLEVEQILFSKLNSVVTGKIQVTESAEFTLTEELLTLRDYIGDLESTIKNGKVSLVLNGNVKDVKVNSKKFDAQVN